MELGEPGDKGIARPACLLLGRVLIRLQNGLELGLEVLSRIGVRVGGRDAPVEVVDDVKILALLQTDNAHLVEGEARVGLEVVGKAVVGQCGSVARLSQSGLNVVTSQVAEAYKSIVTGIQHQGVDLARDRADDIATGRAVDLDSLSNALQLDNIVARREALDISLVEFLGNVQEVRVLFSKLPLLHVAPVVLLLLRGALLVSLGLFAIALLGSRLISPMLVRVLRQVSQATQGSSVFVIDAGVHRPHCVVGALGDSILKVEVDGLHAGKAESMLRAAISIRGAADCEPLSSLFQLRIYRLELGDVDASVIIFGELLELLGEELSQLERRAGMVVRSVTGNGWGFAKLAGYCRNRARATAEGRGHSHVPPRVSRLGRKVRVLGRGSLSSGSLHGRKVGRVSAIGEVGRETWRARSTKAREVSSARAGRDGGGGGRMSRGTILESRYRTKRILDHSFLEQDHGEAVGP